MAICLTVRRFRCQVPSCQRRTFAEQVEGLTFRYGRRSQLQQTKLVAIARCLARRAWARLARMLHCRVSPNTLLNVESLLDPLCRAGPPIYTRTARSTVQPSPRAAARRPTVAAAPPMPVSRTRRRKAGRTTIALGPV
ncbi:hypothetical protein [Streptomyces sp. NPDC051776]|uniref:hypothetical protein n=1 Tax=Streptomyces sp. NPDC051776 TaxID=3155414 RepID=UPI00343F8995